MKGWKLTVQIALVVIALFAIVSVVISCVHNQSLIAEWQNWFGVAKEAAPAVEAAVHSI